MRALAHHTGPVPNTSDSHAHPVASTPLAVCGGCTARWRSKNLAHCGACHHSFGSVDLFDRHRVSDAHHGKCSPPRRRGVTLVDGVWREAAA